MQHEDRAWRAKRPRGGRVAGKLGAVTITRSTLLLGLGPGSASYKSTPGNPSAASDPEDVAVPRGWAALISGSRLPALFPFG